MGVQVKLGDLLRTHAIPERFRGDDTRRQALYQVYVPLPVKHPPMRSMAVPSPNRKPNRNNNKLCARPHDMPPPLNAARCSPAPAHTRLTPAAPSAPCAMNIHDRQAAARSGYDYGVVHIKYIET